MLYKTIIQTLLEQRPKFHEQLRQDRKLLTTLETYATELKSSHESWMRVLSQENPDRQKDQVVMEAFEMALSEMEDRLPNESPAADQEELSLDQAMAFVRSRSPRG